MEEKDNLKNESPDSLSDTKENMKDTAVEYFNIDDKTDVNELFENAFSGKIPTIEFDLPIGEKVLQAKLSILGFYDVQAEQGFLYDIVEDEFSEYREKLINIQPSAEDVKKREAAIARGLLKSKDLKKVNLNTAKDDEVLRLAKRHLSSTEIAITKTRNFKNRFVQRVEQAVWMRTIIDILPKHLLNAETDELLFSTREQQKTASKYIGDVPELYYILQAQYFRLQKMKEMADSNIKKRLQASGAK